ncbi:hypothetical protein GCM10023209_05020 [Roseibacterium beibuensis]|uniref:Uncharacterized protein n=1 Tax=[Roseibacterium] beibuensis TaxID=1193142 RepID=A0ABP9KYK7_9RHOB
MTEMEAGARTGISGEVCHLGAEYSGPAFEAWLRRSAVRWAKPRFPEWTLPVILLDLSIDRGKIKFGRFCEERNAAPMSQPPRRSLWQWCWLSVMRWPPA